MKPYDKHLGIWRFGITLARRFRFSVKLGSLTLLLVLPILALTFALVQRQSKELAAAQAEVQGLTLQRSVLQLLQSVQEHRVQVLRAGAGGDGQLAAARKQQAEARQRIEAAVAAAGQAELKRAWAPTAQALERLGTEAKSADAATSAVLHASAVRTLRSFQAVVETEYALRLDPDDTTQALTQSLGAALAAADQVSVLRAARFGKADEVAGAALLLPYGQAMDELATQRERLVAQGLQGLGLQAAIDAAEALRQAVKDAAGDPSSFDARGEVAAAGFKALQDQLVAALATQLDAQALRYATRRNLMAGGALVLLLALTYLLVTFYKSFTIDMRRLSYALREVGHGNLRVVCTTRGKDELGDLADLLRSMVADVSAMVAAVGSDAALVAHVGRDLCEGNEELSARTEQQAVNVAQTTGRVRDLASTVAQNAQAVASVNDQAVTVRDVAEAGAGAMEKSIRSVEAIQVTAHRMNEIIGVIDMLAFQTNILALNAAVEAARAGEQGRGFAVVATEVRTLAQRSATSAKEIRSLIQSSSSQVETSVALIKSAGEGMARIVSGIRSVSDGVSGISASSREQSAGIGDISGAMARLDDITGQNSQMVVRAVEPTRGMEARASSISHAIGNFKLQQGVADEAMELVTRALDFRRRCASRDDFLKGLTEKDNAFFDRDMYVFVLDTGGTYRAFGGNPAKVGTRVQDIPGVKGQQLLDDIMAQAARGTGWVEYDIANPTTGVVQAKMSYVSPIPGFDGLALGCGVYKNLIAT